MSSSSRQAKRNKSNRTTMDEPINSDSNETKNDENDETTSSFMEEESETSSENDKKRSRDDSSSSSRREFLSNYLNNETDLLNEYNENLSSLSLKSLHDLYDQISTFKDESTQRIKILENLVGSINKNEDLHAQLNSPESSNFENKSLQSEEIDRVDGNNSNSNTICGIVNSRGKPCQRTGYCPFHHKTSRKKQKVELSDGEEEEEEQKREILSSTRKLDRLASMRVSILLIAAAAIEKQSLEMEKAKSVNQTSLTNVNNNAMATTASTVQNPIENSSGNVSNDIPSEQFQ